MSLRRSLLPSHSTQLRYPLYLDLPLTAFLFLRSVSWRVKGDTTIVALGIGFGVKIDKALSFPGVYLDNFVTSNVQVRPDDAGHLVAKPASPWFYFRRASTALAKQLNPAVVRPAPPDCRSTAPTPPRATS